MSKISTNEEKDLFLNDKYYVKKSKKLTTNFITDFITMAIWTCIAEMLPIYALCVTAYKINDTLIDIGCLIGVLWIFGGVYRTIGNFFKKYEKYKKDKKSADREAGRCKGRKAAIELAREINKKKGTTNSSEGDNN